MASDSDSNYVRLSCNASPEKDIEASSSIPAAQTVASSYWVIPIMPRSQGARRRCWMVSACGVALITLGVLLFFLLPRTPFVSLRSVKFIHDTNVTFDESCISGDRCQIYGELSLQNKNYYSVRWSDLDFTLYGQESPDSNKYLGLGKFQSNKKFSTKALGTTTVEVPLTVGDVRYTAKIARQLYENHEMVFYAEGWVNAISYLRCWGKTKMRTGHFTLVTID